MFSGLLIKISISIVIGIVIGALDAAAFYITAKRFFNDGKLKAAVFEAIRMVALVAIIIGIAKFIPLSFWCMVLTAIGVSMAGKMVVSFRKLRNS
jgi:hypothetical protein